MSVSTLPTPAAAAPLWLDYRTGVAWCTDHAPTGLAESLTVNPWNATHRLPDRRVLVRVVDGLVAAGAPSSCSTCRAPARTQGAVVR